MTESVLYAQLTQEENKILDESIAHLRHKQIRISDQRKAVLAYLIHSHHHPTAEQIYQDLVAVFPGISLATVYNNLTTFIDEGLVAELKFTDVTSYFDFRGDQHGHVRCMRCGQIMDFEIENLSQIRQVAQLMTGYQVARTNVALQGICPTCQHQQITEANLS